MNWFFSLTDANGWAAVQGTVKANKYRPFSASDRAERGADS